MRSNCLLFACALCRRRQAKGREGYLVMRWSRWGAFPHLLYAERRRNGLLRVVSYRPTAPRPRRCPPPVFKGSSRWGDL